MDDILYSREKEIIMFTEQEKLEITIDGLRNGDIFITTSGSVGAINVGQQLQVTGSQIIEKDTSGVIRNKKTY